MNKPFKQRLFVHVHNEHNNHPAKDRLTQVTSFAQSPDVAGTLSKELEAHAITVLHQNAAEPSEIEASIISNNVAIIDDGDGWSRALSLAQRVRTASPIGIVLLTERTGRDDRLLALSLGIDHVLGKPVDMAELAAIIRNLTRFTGNTDHAPRRGEENDSWALDHVRWRLIAPNDGAVHLSTAEYTVLNHLMDQPGLEQAREDLAQHLHARKHTANTRGLDVLISKLRAKVERETGHSLPLRSARGIGYVFAGAVTPRSESMGSAIRTHSSNAIDQKHDASEDPSGLHIIAQTSSSEA